MAVVATFRDLSGAEVASATLDAAGIVNSLDDDFTIGVLWTYSTALGGIRLNVADRDAGSGTGSSRYPGPHRVAR